VRLWHGETHAKAIALMNSHLAAAIDLHAQVKQAHWNVRGGAIHRAASAVQRDRG